MQVRLRKAVRIVDAHRVGPVQRAHQHRRYVRLHLLQRGRVDGAVVDAELAVPALGLGKAPVALALGAKDLHPAGAADEAGRVRAGGERIVLVYAVLDQLRVMPRHFGVARRPRVAPVLQ